MRLVVLYERSVYALCEFMNAAICRVKGKDVEMAADAGHDRSLAAVYTAALFVQRAARCVIAMSDTSAERCLKCDAHIKNSSHIAPNSRRCNLQRRL